jgi:hypothetical protein
MLTLPLSNCLKSLKIVKHDVICLATGTVFFLLSLYTIKKISDFTVPSRDVTNQTLPGRREGKIDTLFLQCKANNILPVFAKTSRGEELLHQRQHQRVGPENKQYIETKVTFYKKYVTWILL